MIYPDKIVFNGNTRVLQSVKAGKALYVPVDQWQSTAYMVEYQSEDERIKMESMVSLLVLHEINELVAMGINPVTELPIGVQPEE